MRKRFWTGCFGSRIDLVAELNELAESSEPEAEELIRYASTYLNEAVAIASLPADVVDKVPRYEAHLDRSLKRAIEQLRDLITNRQRSSFRNLENTEVP